MSYNVSITRAAQRDLAGLPAQVRQRVANAVLALADDPRPYGCKRLTGRPEWRIRVGEYRAIYEIDDTNLSVTIIQVGHRRDVYTD